MEKIPEQSSLHTAQDRGAESPEEQARILGEALLWLVTQDMARPQHTRDQRLLKTQRGCVSNMA